MTEADSACPVREGDVVAGKYRVERVIGKGGMGVVVAAVHMQLDQRVALKFLLPEGAARPDIAERFDREARAAARIHCEHVARVIDVGTLADGAPYMVMEYMDGADLEQILAREGPLPVEVATDYVLQATEAIAEAHALGIVHRDLKPANLFLAKRPNGQPIVKVLDFGISKATLSTSQAPLTNTAHIVGSPLYMSPEQLTSAKSVDARSDVWALGVVLYQLLTGRAPFTADSMPELVAAILSRAEDPIRSVRPDVPGGLEAAVQRCLAKEPAQRFSNVAELATAIAPFGAPGSVSSVARITHVLGVRVAEAGGPTTTAGVAGVATAGGAMTSAPWSQSVPGLPPRRSRWRPLFAIPAALVALGVGALWLTRGSSASNASAGPPADPSTSVNSGTPSAPRDTAAPETPPAASSPATSSATKPEAVDTPVPVTSSVRTGTNARPNASAAPAPPATPSAAPCHRVSYFDEDGNKRFRWECR